MKCQNLFSGKNKKNIPICRLLKFYPECKRVKLSDMMAVNSSGKKMSSNLF